ncbi:hypothetical protein DINM_002837 [Dirofilaria immitis]|nr:hypothetical protein [Dirofilaria immitis]
MGNIGSSVGSGTKEQSRIDLSDNDLTASSSRQNLPRKTSQSISLKIQAKKDKDEENVEENIVKYQDEKFSDFYRLSVSSQGRKISALSLSQRQIVKGCMDKAKDDIAERIYRRIIEKREDFRKFVETLSEKERIELANALRIYLKNVVNQLSDGAAVQRISEDFGARHVQYRSHGFRPDFFAVTADAVTTECVLLDAAIHPASEALFAWSTLTAFMFSSVRDGYYNEQRRIRKTSQQINRNKISLIDASDSLKCSPQFHCLMKKVMLSIDRPSSTILGGTSDITLSTAVLLYHLLGILIIKFLRIILQMMTGRRQHKPIPDEAPFKAYVGNLPLDLVPGDLDSLFRDYAVIEAKMMRDYENDRFKGFAYIEFRTREDLERALSLNGVEYDGRMLRVDVADAPRGRERRGGGRGNFGGRGGSSRSGGQPFRGDSRRGGGASRSGERRNSRNDNFGRSDYDRLDRGKGHQDVEFVAHSSAPGRPHLNLKPRTTDPKELEKLKKIEEEETRKRQARIFGVKE